MISIINKKNTFFCGRPSRLGNPFVIGKDGTRDEVIEKYKIWLDEKIKSKNPSVCYMLSEIYKAALKSDIQLECYCVPQNCHCSVILDVILNKAKSKNNNDYIKMCEPFI